MLLRAPTILDAAKLLLHALVKSGLPETLAAVLGEALRGITERLRHERLEADTLSAVGRIVAGIERGHPDWDGPTKRAFALDAIAQWSATASVDLPPGVVGWLIETSHLALPRKGDSA